MFRDTAEAEAKCRLFTYFSLGAHFPREACFGSVFLTGLSPLPGILCVLCWELWINSIPAGWLSSHSPAWLLLWYLYVIVFVCHLQTHRSKLAPRVLFISSFLIFYYNISNREKCINCTDNHLVKVFQLLWSFPLPHSSLWQPDNFLVLLWSYHTAFFPF